MKKMSLSLTFLLLSTNIFYSNDLCAASKKRKGESVSKHQVFTRFGNDHEAINSLFALFHKPDLKLSHITMPEGLLFDLCRQAHTLYTTLKLTEVLINDEKDESNQVKKGLIYFAKSNALLESIDITESGFINDEIVIAFAEHCPKLQSVRLAGCLPLTDTAIITLAKRRPNLRVLSLFNCLDLSDESINALAKNCHQLEELEIDICPSVTIDALIELIKACPRLKRIYHPHLKVKLKIKEEGIEGCILSQEDIQKIRQS